MNCFHAQTRQYLSQIQQFCCWLGAIYAAFEHSIYLMHVIFFNLQGINLDKSRKLLSSYFVHALSSNYSETGTRMKYCVTLFFPNITLS